MFPLVWHRTRSHMSYALQYSLLTRWKDWSTELVVLINHLHHRRDLYCNFYMEYVSQVSRHAHLLRLYPKLIPFKTEVYESILWWTSRRAALENVEIETVLVQYNCSGWKYQSTPGVFNALAQFRMPFVSQWINLCWFLLLSNIRIAFGNIQHVCRAYTYSQLRLKAIRNKSVAKKNMNMWIGIFICFPFFGGCTFVHALKYGERVFGIWCSSNTDSSMKDSGKLLPKHLDTCSRMSVCAVNVSSHTLRRVWRAIFQTRKNCQFIC